MIYPLEFTLKTFRRVVTVLTGNLVRRVFDLDDGSKSFTTAMYTKCKRNDFIVAGDAFNRGNANKI